MDSELDVVGILVQYLERIVKGARGNAVTFSASTVVSMWGKWFNHGRAPVHLRHKLSRLLNGLAACGLLERYTYYRYRLVRGSALWVAAERGNLREYLERIECALIWVE